MNPRVLHSLVTGSLMFVVMVLCKPALFIIDVVIECRVVNTPGRATRLSVVFHASIVAASAAFFCVVYLYTCRPCP